MEEIKAIIDVLNNRINEATNDNQKQIACRNKMLFLIGVNVGLRASDLTQLRWSYFYENDMTFKKSYVLQPKKQKKTGKFVEIFFNKTVKKAIENYVNDYPVEDLDGYLFTEKAWVQSYGTRCVKPPIIFGDMANDLFCPSSFYTYTEETLAILHEKIIELCDKYSVSYVDFYSTKVL